MRSEPVVTAVTSVNAITPGERCHRIVRIGERTVTEIPVAWRDFEAGEVTRVS